MMNTAKKGVFIPVRCLQASPLCGFTTYTTNTSITTYIILGGSLYYRLEPTLYDITRGKFFLHNV